VVSELATLKKSEDAIRRALVNAQNAGARILKDAEERSELVLKATKDNCDKILSDFKKQIKEERDTLNLLRVQVAEFKNRIFTQYQEHIELLGSISPDVEDIGEWNLSANEITTKALGQIKLDISNSKDTIERYDIEDAIKQTPSQIDDAMLEELVAAKEQFDGATELMGDDLSKTAVFADEDTAENSADQTAVFDDDDDMTIFGTESSTENGNSDEDITALLSEELHGQELLAEEETQAEQSITIEDEDEDAYNTIFGE